MFFLGIVLYILYINCSVRKLIVRMLYTPGLHYRIPESCPEIHDLVSENISMTNCDLKVTAGSLPVGRVNEANLKGSVV
jgi:hypothetical protein